MKQRRFALVYQGGIANVFEVDCFNTYPFGRNAKRIRQSSFTDCISFAQGIAHSGHSIFTFACNLAGDITDAEWTEDLESQPFFDQFVVVEQTKSPNDLDENEPKMSMTMYEFKRRFGMTDETCNIIGINPYFFNEGGDGKSAISLNRKKAMKLGIPQDEFENRAN